MRSGQTNDVVSFTVPRLSAEFRAIIGRKEEIDARRKEIRLKYYYRQAQETIAEMDRAFKDQNYPQVESIHRRLTEIARTRHDTDHPVSFPQGEYLKAGFWKVRAARNRIR